MSWGKPLKVGEELNTNFYAWQHSPSPLLLTDLHNVNFVGFLIDCLIIRLAAVLHLLVAACAVTVLQLVSQYSIDLN